MAGAPRAWLVSKRLGGRVGERFGGRLGERQSTSEGKNVAIGYT